MGGYFLLVFFTTLEGQNGVAKHSLINERIQLEAKLRQERDREKSNYNTARHHEQTFGCIFIALVFRLSDNNDVTKGERIENYTGFLNRLRAKLRDWAVRSVQAGSIVH